MSQPPSVPLPSVPTGLTLNGMTAAPQTTLVATPTATSAASGSLSVSVSGAVAAAASVSSSDQPCTPPATTVSFTLPPPRRSPHHHSLNSPPPPSFPLPATPPTPSTPSTPNSAATSTTTSATSSPSTKLRRLKPPAVSVNNMSPSSGGLEVESPSQAKNAAGMQELALPQEFRAGLNIEDLEILEELGSGNGGTVNLVRHRTTRTILARKIIHVETRHNVRDQILKELRIMHKCKSPYIVTFYGAILNEGDISICMEYMSCGSLDQFYKKVPIPEPVIGQITYAVLKGLVYLYDKHRIIHRDVKPSNILMNEQGQVKIADFGVSSQLVNTNNASTFVGTSAYMSPERIQGGSYSVLSDVWSVGLTLMELALGRFPFPPDGEAAGKVLVIFELLEYIVNEPVPKLPDGKYSAEFETFLGKCLIKETKESVRERDRVEDGKDKHRERTKKRLTRPTPTELLATDPFVLRAERDSATVDMKAFAQLVLQQKGTQS